jgi:outer membrane biosynthesis protein TonB
VQIRHRLLIFCGIAFSVAGCATPPASNTRPTQLFVKEYQNRVNGNIGAVWYWKISAVRDSAAFGTVKVTFTIDQDGRTKVASTSKFDGANDVAVRIVRQAIHEAPRSKPPPEVWAWAENQPIVCNLSFTYYNSQVR